MKFQLPLTANDQVELVMFDLDGTLVDSVPDIAFAMNQTLKDLKFKEAPLEKIQTWVGNGSLMLVRRALAFTYSCEEKELDKQIKDTVNRNLLRQQQIAYLQRLRQHQHKKRRFGLKFK